jgi:hypothetical protein
MTRRRKIRAKTLKNGKKKENFILILEIKTIYIIWLNIGKNFTGWLKMNPRRPFGNYYGRLIFIRN